MFDTLAVAAGVPPADRSGIQSFLGRSDAESMTCLVLTLEASLGANNQLHTEHIVHISTDMLLSCLREGQLCSSK